MNQSHSCKVYLSWYDVELLTRTVTNKIKKSKKSYDAILGITNGGIIPARLLARELNINLILLLPIRDKRFRIEEMPALYKEKKYLIVDEIYDTGNTYSVVSAELRRFDCDFAFLLKRRHNNTGNFRAYIGKVLNHSKWVQFPWERE